MIYLGKRHVDTSDSRELWCVADEVLCKEIERLKQNNINPTSYVKFTFNKNYQVTLGSKIDFDGSIEGHERTTTGFLVRCFFEKLRIQDCIFDILMVINREADRNYQMGEICNGDNCFGGIVGIVLGVGYPTSERMDVAIALRRGYNNRYMENNGER